VPLLCQAPAVAAQIGAGWRVDARPWPWLVGRMRRIHGPTIGPEVDLVPMQLGLLLAAIVAGCAQGLERPQEEGFPVAPMGLQVVGDGGRGEGLACQAEGAQRLGCELALGPLAP